MAKGSDKKSSRNFLQKLWHGASAFFLLFIAQLVYIVLLKWINPPIYHNTTQQLDKRPWIETGYIKTEIYFIYMKLAVIFGKPIVS